MSVRVKVLLSALVIALVALAAIHPSLHTGPTVLAFTPERGVTAGDVAAVLVGLALLAHLWRR